MSVCQKIFKKPFVFIVLVFSSVGAFHGASAADLSITPSPSQTVITGSAVTTLSASGGTLINGDPRGYKFSLRNGSPSCPLGRGLLSGSGASRTYTAPRSPCSVIAVVTDTVGQSASTNLTIVSTVSITPANVNVSAGGTQLFNATGENGPFVFSMVSGQGSIDDSSGVYNAPNNTTIQRNIIVKVIDTLGNESRAIVTVRSPLRISPSSVTTTNRPIRFRGIGGLPPYIFSLDSGAGAVSGSTFTPIIESSIAAVKVTDSLGAIKTADVTVLAPLRIFPPQKTLVVNDSVLLTAHGGTPRNDGTGFTKVRGAGYLDESSGNSVYYVPTAVGKSLIRYTDANGKSATATINGVLSTSRLVNPLSGFSYPQSPALLKVGRYVKSSPRIAHGEGVLFTVSPALPAGLKFNRYTGVISGTPTASALAADYTITASSRPTAISILGVLSGYTTRTTTVPIVVAAEGTNPVTQVVTGREHTCALFDNGRVKCWGRSRYGQSGTLKLTRGDVSGEMGSALPFISFGEGYTAKRVSVGTSGACAILNDDTVRCWGLNGFGQVGIGPESRPGGGVVPEDVFTPAMPDLGSGRTAKAIRTGSSATCAILDDDTLKCWGSNSSGRLGLDNTTTLWAPQATPVNLGSGRAAKAVAMGVASVCAILDDDSLKCWGLNSNGELGQGNTTTVGDSASRSMVNLSSIDLGVDSEQNPLKATAVDIGYSHTCAILNTGRVKCWGLNTFGQLGQGNTTSIGNGIGPSVAASDPIDLGSSEGVPFTALAISASYYSTCALLNNYRIKCWGDNSSGQLGLGSTSNVGDQAGSMGNNLPFVDLGTENQVPLTVKALSNRAGFSQSMCAVLSDDRVKCWGANSSGVLGLGDVTARGTDSGQMGDSLPYVDLDDTVLSVSTGLGHGCAILSSGGVKCWGSGVYGLLGVRPYLSEPPAEWVDLGTGKLAQQISTVYYSTCALLTDGTIKCWGLNSSGELGLGDTTMRGITPLHMGDNLPTVNLGTGVKAKKLASVAHGRSMCAILTNNSLKCWGPNTYGELGLGDTTTRGTTAASMGSNLPVVPLGGQVVLDVTVGANHTCALVEGSKVICWGRNHYGQLGLGDETNRGDGVTALGAETDLDGIPVSIAAGGDHTCAVMSDGALKCWGRNNAGELGNTHVGVPQYGRAPQTSGANIPTVNLGSGKTVVQVVSKNFNTCARLDGGELKCWGMSQALLGKGSPYDSAGQFSWNLFGLGRNSPDEMGDNLTPIDFGSSRKVFSFGGGVYHACAILDNLSLKCWGYNQFGQLGIGSEEKDFGDLASDMGDDLPVVDLNL